MDDGIFGSLLQSIVQNPQPYIDALAANVLNTTPRVVEYALDAVNAENNLTRAALVGLLLDTLNKDRPECRSQLRHPLDPLRDPSSGFTIRDVVILPVQSKRATAHSLPGLGSTPYPSAVPMIVEVTDVGFEARPDLVGVVETALSDEPSESTQVLRAFVAGYRGYNDCPDLTQGRPELSALVSQLLERSLGTQQDLFATNWLRESPWTAVMAAPLETPTFGSVVPGETSPCSQDCTVDNLTVPVPITAPNTP
jgi:hypothetical protein